MPSVKTWEIEGAGSVVLRVEANILEISGNVGNSNARGMKLRTGRSERASDFTLLNMQHSISAGERISRSRGGLTRDVGSFLTVDGR